PHVVLSHMATSALSIGIDHGISFEYVRMIDHCALKVAQDEVHLRTFVTLPVELVCQEAQLAVRNDGDDRPRLSQHERMLFADALPDAVRANEMNQDVRIE